ncbi:uncharacterized protein LOC108266668, partial [Tachysurus ichikawai]
MSSEDLQLLRRPCPPKRSLPHREFTPVIMFITHVSHLNPNSNAPQFTSTLKSPLAFLRDDPRYAPPPPDVLQDFLKPTQSESEPVQSSQSQKEVIKDLSRWNYRKFINHFLSELHDGQQREVARQLLSCEPFPHLERRIPQWQIKC